MRENAKRQASDADKCKDPTQWVLKNLEEIDDGTICLRTRVMLNYTNLIL